MRLNSKTTALLSLLVLISTFMVSGCISITPPQVNITTEKTAIERQIIGEYRELEKDAWAISSARTLSRGTGSGDKLMGSDRELFIAMKIREFHLDRIRIYKQEGALGETMTGYISYRSVKKYERNAAEKNILLTVIKNENGARKTIFTRSLFLLNKEEPSRSQTAAFGILFATEQRKTARKNEWIQEKNGRWIRK